MKKPNNLILRIVRVAARTKNSETGQTPVEALKPFFQKWQSLETLEGEEEAVGEMRLRLAHAAARCVIPGASWGAGVVDATFQLWSTPGRKSRNRLAVPVKTTLPVSVEVEPSMKLPSDEYQRWLDADAQYTFDLLDRRAKHPSVPPKPASPEERKRRQPRAILDRDIELFCCYQWGRQSRATLGRQYKLSPRRVGAIIRRIARRAQVRIRRPLKAGRPRKRR